MATISGTPGNDTLVGTVGDDSISGGRGNDTLTGNAGNDTLDGGQGADLVDGGPGNDLITGVDSADTVTGGLGDDTIELSGNIGSLSPDGGAGGETAGDLLKLTGNLSVAQFNPINFERLDWGGFGISGNSAANQVNLTGLAATSPAGLVNLRGGHDRFDGSESGDNVRGGSGNDTLLGHGGNDTLDGGAGADLIDGGAGADLIQGVDRFDTVTGGSGDDTVDLRGNIGSVNLDGGTGLETTGDVLRLTNNVSVDQFTPLNFEVIDWGGRAMTGSNGANLVDLSGLTAASPAGLVNLRGGADQFIGSESGDHVSGGGGNDTLSGNGGNDTLQGGAGINAVSGGMGDDTFIYTRGETLHITDFTLGSTNIGNGVMTDNDFVDLTPYFTDISDLLDHLTPGGVLENGDMAGGQISGLGVLHSLTPSQIREVTGVPCFAGETKIATEFGERRIDELEMGDLVETEDNGLQPVRWIGKRKFRAIDLHRNPKLYPVRIMAGALGQGLPRRDLLVSRQHRMIVRSKIIERCADTRDVLIPAIKLTGAPGIFVDDSVSSITYVHLLLDHHEILFAEGSPSESLLPGPMALDTMDEESQAEIHAIFPELFGVDHVYPAARTILDGKRAKNILRRHLKNAVALLHG